MTLKKSRQPAKRIRDLEADFDRGADLSDYFDFSKATLIRKVNVDFPDWMIQALDRHALRIGINRQALIKTWINDCLERHKGDIQPQNDAATKRKSPARGRRAN
jgi:hypothetical protein